MNHALELAEQVPMPAYAFRNLGDDFTLETINAFGRSRNPGLVELCGKSMVALYRDQPLVIEAARRCAAEQATVALELPVRRYDRTEATQFLRLTFVPVPPAHIVLFIQDIENSAVAQIAISEGESRYQSLMASLPDAVLVRGVDSRILFCNHVAVGLFGARSQAELLGEIEALPPGFQLQTEKGELVSPCDYPSRKVLVTGNAELGQVFALVGNGKLLWVRVAAQPIRSATGNLTGSVTTFTDVTERVTAQGELRESGVRLDLALSAAKMGVWEFEPSTDVGFWSPNLNSIFMLAGRARGLSGFVAHIHPDDRSTVVAKANELIKGLVDDSFEQEFRIVGEDQVTRWARIRGTLAYSGTT